MQRVRYAKTGLDRLRYAALSSWFVGSNGEWSGAADVTMWIATESDPGVPLLYHPNAWEKRSLGVWRRQDNSRAIEATILAQSDKRFGGFEFNPYSTTREGAFVAPVGFTHRSAKWSPLPYIPSDAIGADNADGHMAVLQPNGLVLETFATIRLSSGAVACGFAGYTDPRGIGDGRANGRRASMVPSYAGILRLDEIRTGIIAHALAIAIGPEKLAAAMRPPATAFDRDTRNYAGDIPMGARLAIPHTIRLEELPFKTSFARHLAKAAQRFGCYVVDRGGPGTLIFCTETDAKHLRPWNTALAADLMTIRDSLQLVTTKYETTPEEYASQ